MKSTEKGVKFISNYYIYSPSMQAQRVFLYPLFVGCFHYDQGYSIKRLSYDSYLLMYIKQGSIDICINNNHYLAHEGQIVFIDCYKTHYYSATTEAVVEWLHFDGICAKEYFLMITGNTNFVFSVKDSFIFQKNLSKIYTLFNENKPIKEALISQYIISMLTTLIIKYEHKEIASSTSYMIEDAISYINENITLSISLTTLASHASLSPYYFTRVFKKETGFTPYQYILYTRINHAKFLLKNTELSIKEICFHCGFSSESSFCTSFKKWVSMTPTDYRIQEI